MDEPTTCAGAWRSACCNDAGVWGLCFVAIRLGLEDAPVLWFAALRALIAAGALLRLCLVQGRGIPRGRRTWALTALMGVVNVTVAFPTMFAWTAGMVIGAAAVLAWFREAARSRLDLLTDGPCLYQSLAWQRPCSSPGNVRLRGQRPVPVWSWSRFGLSFTARTAGRARAG